MSAPIALLATHQGDWTACSNCCEDVADHRVGKCPRCGDDGLCPDCLADPRLHGCDGGDEEAA